MKTVKLLSIAALAFVGALTAGCNSDDKIMDQPQQPQNTDNTVTLTTTVSMDGAAGTRALTSTGVKTFAEGETMAIYYWKNKGNDHEKAVSAPLTAGDITNGGKSATFTFTLDNPYKDMSVVYTYPAAMANADFTPNYDALYNNQDGTLATLASDFDFCTRSGAWSGENLPSLTLVNQLAILAITLKNADGSSDITSSITGLTLSDGTKTCNSHTVRKIMDESLCKVENMEYLRIRDDVDEEYAYARYYRNSNEVEFEECIKSIAVEQTSNSYDDYDYTLYKKANDKKEEFKKRSEKFLRKMSKHIEK